MSFSTFMMMAQRTALPDPVSEGKVINVMHLHLRGFLRTAMDERSRLPGGSGEHQLVQELLHQRRHHVLHARQRRRASHDGGCGRYISQLAPCAGLLQRGVWTRQLRQQGRTRSGVALLAEGSGGFANAFWAGDETEDGKTVGNFYFGYDYTGKRSETSLDSCAHELTHGVTAYTANLQYKGESGALNESFSDLIGVACELEGDRPHESLAKRHFEH